MGKKNIKDFGNLFRTDKVREAKKRPADNPAKNLVESEFSPGDRADDTLNDEEIQRATQTRKVNADLLEQALIDARNAKKKTTPTHSSPPEAHQDDRVEGAKLTNVTAQIREADFYLEQQLFTDAHDVLEKVVEKVPDNTTANAKLAEIEKLRSQDPKPISPSDTGEIEKWRPESQSRDLSPEEEESEHEEFSPDSHPTIDESDVHLVAGVAHMQAGRYDQAIAELNEALEWNQNEMTCQLLIGACFFQKGTAVKAIKHFKIGLHIQGISPKETIPFYFELGRTYEFLRDFQEAIYYYSKVAKIYPDHPEIQKKIDYLQQEEEQTTI